jgi:hypothetical protein
MISTTKNRGPYSLDRVVYTHKGRKITSIVNSPAYEDIIAKIDTVFDYEVGYIPAGLKNRPDLIANEYYGDPRNWWLIMFVNNISDPFESLGANQRILLPKNK